jgi:tRNA dimethylallyltransferase
VHQLKLDEYYSAAQFESDVLQLLDNHFKTHDVALMSGGSMMYIDAVCKGIDDIPTISDDVRNLMHERLRNEGLDVLKAELRMIDPDYYAIVDLKNQKRIVHALEIYYQSGKPFSSFRTHTQKERPFRIVKIGLMRSREVLFQRINQRVDEMMKEGLMEEVRSVYHLKHLNSLNTVGYKELFKVLDGEWDLPMAVERIKKNTRVYAKKQMTWFKHDEDIHWLNLDDTSVEEAISSINEIIKMKN